MNDKQLKEILEDVTQLMAALGKLTVQMSMVRTKIENRIKK